MFCRNKNQMTDTHLDPGAIQGVEYSQDSKRALNTHPSPEGAEDTSKADGKLGHHSKGQHVPGAPLYSVPFIAKQSIIRSGKDRIHCAQRRLALQKLPFPGPKRIPEIQELGIPPRNRIIFLRASPL